MEMVVITGGSGFIGSHLCEDLLKDYEVLCIDDFSSGRDKNVAHLKNYKNFKIIKHNIIEPLKLDNIAFVFHLASRASPSDYQAFPIHTLRTNSEGTYNMLELARKNNAKFLFASTSEVYGDPLEHPQKETYWGNVNPVGIRSCYDEGKRFGEALTMGFVREYNSNVRIARIFNTYGPGMKANDGRVVSNFIFQALKNEPLTVYGDGLQTRSFCYVSDMVDGIKKAMLNEKSRGEVFNLGNPKEFTIIELARVIKKLTNSKSEIVFKPLPEDDPTKRNPDITKAGQILGWEPKVTLEQGLVKMIEHFREELR